MDTAAAQQRGSERGQALIVALGAVFVVMLGAGVLAALGGALAEKGRMQRATDLAALSAARSMRDDFARLFEPPLIGGRLNPRHLAQASYLARARDAALEAGRHNGLELAPADVSFPGGGSGAPVRVKVKVKDRLPARGGDVPVRCRRDRGAVTANGRPALARGLRLRLHGPLAYRQGKPMRPDVARAFDRMEAAARADGVRLIVTSGYRSDAEQAELYERTSRPEVGRPARQVAAPLGHGARPRASQRVRVASSQRRALSLRSEIQLGTLALRLLAEPALDARSRARRRAPR